MVIVWAAVFVDRKYGALILLSLSVLLFLVGGGFAPIFTSILATIAAARIDKPITRARKLLPEGVWNFLAKIWLGVLVAFVVIFFISVENVIFGWPLTSFVDADTTLTYLNILANLMLGLMLFSVVTAFAHDILAAKIAS